MLGLGPVNDLNWHDNMYLLTEWEGRTREIFGPRSWRTCEVRALLPRVKYFPVVPDLNSVNKHFIIWALNAIHKHPEPEDEVWTKKLQICTERLSMYNMLLAFAFLAVNNLDI